MGTKEKIAIFGKKDCRQVQAVGDAVSRAGGEPILLNIQQNRDPGLHTFLDEEHMIWDAVDLSEIQAIYIRGMALNTLPAVPPVMNAASHAEWRTRYLVEQQYQAFAYSFFDALEASGKLVINPLSRYYHHDTKAQFYEKLRAWGVDVPRTLTTNEPKRAAAFIEEVGAVVIKPSIGVGSTRILREVNAEALAEIAQTPVMLQEFAGGETFRVHVVGETVVLALRILADEIDSRTDTKGFEFATLPAAEAIKIASINRKLGLHWAAWDVIRTANGQYVYLDCNPGAYYIWVGEAFVRAISDQLAAYLLGFARSGSLVEAAKAVVPWEPQLTQ